MPFSRMSAVSAGGAQDDTACARRRRHVDGLDVLVVGADVADVRKSESDDLPGIGGIGEDFLIAGHGGVEAHLANGAADGAESDPFQHDTVSQHQEGRGFRLGPSGIGLFGAHHGPR
jgi:hypothetical protein